MRSHATIGVDLSAQPRQTAACILDWGRAPARIVHLEAGADNAAIVDLVAAHQPAKVAIDSPFGWPPPFVNALVDFTNSGSWPSGSDRRPLLLRTTDLAVREETGVDPLSVSSNLLAICAMRCAHLLVELAGEDALDRTGAGLVAEVYPAAALRQWGLDPRGYKGTKPEKVAKRQELVATIADASSVWLELRDEERGRLVASDHLLDALASAFVARALEIGQTLPIRAEHRALAASEGWIHLPVRQPLADFDPFVESRNLAGRDE